MSIRGIESAFWGVSGKDPELKQGKNGKSFANFSCSVTVSQAENQWINVICFGETAEKIAKSARKGDRVYVEGSLTLATWETGEGNTRSGLAVSAWKVERLANIGRSCVRPDEDGSPRDVVDQDIPSLPIALPAHKKRKAFGLFRKPRAKTPAPAAEPEFNDPLPF